MGSSSRVGPRVRSLSPCVTKKRLSTVDAKPSGPTVAKLPPRSSSPKPARARVPQRSSAPQSRGRCSSQQPRGRSTIQQPRGRSTSQQPRGRTSSQQPRGRSSSLARNPGKEVKAGGLKPDKTKRAASVGRRLDTVSVVKRSSSPKPARSKASQKRLSVKKPAKNESSMEKNEDSKGEPENKAGKKKKKKVKSPKITGAKKATTTTEEAGKPPVVKKKGSPKVAVKKKPSETTKLKRFRDLIPKGSVSRPKDSEQVRGSVPKASDSEPATGSVNKGKTTDLPQGSMSKPKEAGLPGGSTSRPKGTVALKEPLCSGTSSPKSVDDPRLIISKESNSASSDTVSETSEDDASSCSSNHSSNAKSCDELNRCVSFGTVDVQEFRYSIGHEVVTSNGPPVTLCRKPLRCLNVDLESFEQERLPVRRRLGDLRLSEEDRIIILQKHGFSYEEIELASWESETLRTQRFKSIKNKEWDGWTAASESFSRKLGKITSPQALFGNASF
ncbi:MAG: hypothetical protein SGILL_001195 [Bacillariaceae sp.]